MCFFQKPNRKKDYNKSRQDRSLADDVEQRLKRLKTEDLKENQAREDETVCCFEHCYYLCFALISMSS